MDELARTFLDTLDENHADARLLALAGDPEPERAAAAFRASLGDPTLAACRTQWVPTLLASARPGFGAESLLELAQRRRAMGQALELERAPGLCAVLGGSNFLTRLLLRHPGLVAELEGSCAEEADAAPLSDWAAVRGFKYRRLLGLTARDLLGRPLGDSLRELSQLADRCLEAGLALASEEVGSEAPTLLALGKLGGRELNFSSDVDLLFVYDADRDEAAEAERHESMSRIVRALKRGMEHPSEDGFVYRVDLDLRPEGGQGPLANSVDAALGYYETFGQEWERQMLIRLRLVAGPRAPGEALQRSLTPFVFRRLIDPGVARAVRAMKMRIEDERRRAGRDLEVELKEGPGGIRDVEFLVQAFQLFYGGRETALRSGTVLEILATLGRLGLLPEAAAAELTDAYSWLRRAEHALQLAEERQTQRFPRDAAAQIALARRMGYREPEATQARDRLLDDWTLARATVRAQFEALVLGGDDE